MKMVLRQYQLRFCTPAFLGNAEQSGQWRTPPFKTQLRQWWRVAYVASNKFIVNIAQMREEEGKLFGNAWLDDNFCKSLVRIRLESWSGGTLQRSQWSPLERVQHPESQSASADLYLGYGPVAIFKGALTLKANAAIQAGERNVLSIAYPSDKAPLIEKALLLMSQFGTVGGRSRNGWGSYNLIEHEVEQKVTEPISLRPWHEAIRLDWPHAIGSDSQGALVWQTDPSENWGVLMKKLAVTKIGLRTQFQFPTAKPDGQVHNRHWLSYPITNHLVRSWDKNARLPNSLRFKLRPTDDGQLVGVIFHVPCLPPLAFSPDVQAICHVWETVHRFLDAPERNLKRINA